jgi:hypothetical protein
MKRFLSLLSATFLLPFAAHSASVVWGSQNAERNLLALDDGLTLVPSDTIVRLGWFTNDTVLAGVDTPQEVQALEGNFHELGVLRTPATIAGNPRPGAFAGTTDVDGNALVGKQLWILAYVYSNMSPTSTVADAIATVTQFGAFSMNASNWLIPSDTPLTGQTTIDLGNLNGSQTAANGGKIADLDPNARIPVGRYTSSSQLIAGSRSFALATVPEPSAFGLLALGSIVLARRSRKK